MRKILLLSLFSAVAACAQSVSFGTLVGAPFNDVVKSNSSNFLNATASSTNLTVGPSLRVNLPASFRFEVDALYRPYSFDFLGLKSSSRISAQNWRFPVLLQYRIKTPVVQPFIEGGLSFDHLASLSAAANNITSGPGTLLHTSATGVVVGAGVDAKVPFVKLSAELRFTRDTASHFSDVSNLNQAEVLFGIRF